MLQQPLHFTKIKQDRIRTLQHRVDALEALKDIDDRRVLFLLRKSPLDTLEFTAENVGDPDGYGSHPSYSRDIRLNVAPTRLSHGRAYNEHVRATCEYGRTAPEIMKIAFYHEFGHFALRHLLTTDEVRKVAAAYEQRPCAVTGRAHDLYYEYFPETLAAVLMLPHLRIYDPKGFDKVTEVFKDLVTRCNGGVPLPCP